MRRVVALTSITMLSALTTATTALAVPLFNEPFNAPSGRVSLKNGAKLAGAGSGVSGRSSDRAYTAKVSNASQPKDGPEAIVTRPIAVQGLNQITVTFWYKPSGPQVKDVTLLDTASLVVMGDIPGEWTIRVGAKVKDKKQMYWFHSGKKVPYGAWIQPNQWVFVTVVWDRAGNQVSSFQGTKSRPVKLARRDKRPDRDKPLGGLVQRAKIAQKPATIGNTSGGKYRPFNGSIDNVHIYSKALNLGALEKIRQADLKNQNPPNF